MKLNNLGIFLLIVSCVCVGVIVAGLLETPDIHFKSEVDPLSALSIFVSLVILIYISLLLENSRESTKIKKDIILNRINELLELIKELEVSVENNKVDSSGLNSLLKRVYLKYKNILLIESEAGFALSKFSFKFRKEHRELRTLLTFTEAKVCGQKELSITVDKNVYRYSASRTQEIVHSLSRMTALASKEQIFVSNQ